MFFFNIFKVNAFPLLRFKSYSTGRVKGRISSNHRDSGDCLRISRLVDYTVPYNCLSIVCSILKFKLKPGLILSIFESGFLKLSISPENMSIGSFTLSSLNPLPVQLGNSMPLAYIPVGSRVFNVSSIAKSSGNSIQVLRHKAKRTLCKLPSHELKWLNSSSLATVGCVSNANSKFYKFYKAGQLRWSGRRPHVRGVAMNPIDHPHGGGQGKTSGGRPSVSPFARLTKGYRTVRSKLKNKYIFKSRFAQRK